jgi:hypothetical protein
MRILSLAAIAAALFAAQFGSSNAAPNLGAASAKSQPDLVLAAEQKPVVKKRYAKTRVRKYKATRYTARRYKATAGKYRVSKYRYRKPHKTATRTTTRKSTY